MITLESAVIVKNDYGSVTTLRFSDETYDRYISGTGKTPPYAQIEAYVKEVTSD